MAQLLLTTLGISWAAMLLLWLLSLRLRDASIVDVWWGPGFVLLGTSAWALAPDAAGDLLPVALVTLWGLRLGAHLAWRNAGLGEDPRYQAMRRHFGARFAWVSLFTVFGLQGLLMWVVSLPVQVAQLGPAARGAETAAGALLFAVGLAFEAVGDWQLARFRADPRNAGRVMDRGLWRYTRHPNYFGDCCAWWGVFLVCLAHPGVAWTFVGPLLMTFLLLRVSGVTLLERSIVKRRPGYADYQRRTSAFLPLPPRSPVRKAGNSP